MPPKAATKSTAAIDDAPEVEDLGSAELESIDFDDSPGPPPAPWLPAIAEHVRQLAESLAEARREESRWQIPSYSLLARVEDLFGLVAQHARETWPRSSWLLLERVEQLAYRAEMFGASGARPWWGQMALENSGPILRFGIEVGMIEALEFLGHDHELPGPEEIVVETLDNIGDCPLEFISNYFALRTHEGTQDLDRADRIRSGLESPPKITATIQPPVADGLPMVQPSLDATCRLARVALDHPCPRQD